jgi:hypothetical protein
VKCRSGSFWLVVLTALAHAQAPTGEIAGTVYDPSGGVVPKPVINPWPEPRLRRQEPQSLPAATVVIPLLSISTWPLQRLGFRPCKLFEFPAVYQPLTIRIPRGRCVENIGGRGRRRALCLLRPGRRNLRPNLPACRYGYGCRDANQ